MGFSHIVFGSIFCYNPLLERRVFMSEFEQMSQEDREAWFSELVIAAKAGMKFPDQKSHTEFNDFLWEIAHKLNVMD